MRCTLLAIRRPGMFVVTHVRAHVETQLDSGRVDRSSSHTAPAVDYCHAQRNCPDHSLLSAGTAREDDEDEDISQQSGVQALNHKRGMAPYVFVPWHDVATSPLNLPVEQMDVYIPG